MCYGIAGLFANTQTRKLLCQYLAVPKKNQRFNVVVAVNTASVTKIVINRKKCEIVVGIIFLLRKGFNLMKNWLAVVELLAILRNIWIVKVAWSYDMKLVCIKCNHFF